MDSSMIPFFLDAKRDDMLTYPEIDPVIFSIGRRPYQLAEHPREGEIKCAEC